MQLNESIASLLAVKTLETVTEKEGLAVAQLVDMHSRFAEFEKTLALEKVARLILEAEINKLKDQSRIHKRKMQADNDDLWDLVCGIRQELLDEIGGIVRS